MISNTTKYGKRNAPIAKKNKKVFQCIVKRSAKEKGKKKWIYLRHFQVPWMGNATHCQDQLTSQCKTSKIQCSCPNFHVRARSFVSPSNRLFPNWWPHSNQLVHFDRQIHWMLSYFPLNPYHLCHSQIHYCSFCIFRPTVGWNKSNNEWFIYYGIHWTFTFSQFLTSEKFHKYLFKCTLCYLFI